MSKIIAILILYSMSICVGHSKVPREHQLIKIQSPIILEFPYCDYKKGESREIIIYKKLLETLELEKIPDCNADKCKFAETLKNEIISKMKKVLSERIQKGRIEKYLFCPNYI